MSFIKCIEGKIKSGALTRGDVEKITKKYDDLVERYSKTMGDSDAAMQAAAKLAQIEAEQIAVRRRNTIKAAMKQAEVIKQLESEASTMYDKGLMGSTAKIFGADIFNMDSGTKFGIAIQNLVEKAHIRGKTINKQLVQNLDTLGEKYGSKWGGIVARRDGVDDIVRAAMGETVDDIDARNIGRAVRESFDLAHQKFRAAGGSIGKIENYFPQRHNAKLIKQTDFDEWYEFLLPKLDRERMIDPATGLPFDSVKLKKVLRESYQDITTNGKYSLQKRLNEGKVTPATRGSELSVKREQSRFIHFKNADSFLEYSAKFGTGQHGIYDAILGHLQIMSRDIGNLEILGPKPNAMQRFLSVNMDAKGTSTAKKKFIEGMFDTAMGRGSFGDDKPAWLAALGNVQNVMRSAYLGGASISAISDATFISVASSINGMQSTRALKTYFKLINPASSVDRRIAKRSGYIAELTSGTALSDARFTGESLGGVITGKLAEFTNRASGLESMTNAAKHAVSLEMEATLADMVISNKSWQGLDSDFRKLLEASGLTSDDWSIIKKAKLFEVEENGAKFLRSRDILEVDGVSPEKSMDIANKIDDTIIGLQDLATNEANIKTRTITTGAFAGSGAASSPAVRAFASSVFMFKSFPITVINNHIIPMMQSAAQGKYNHFAQVAIGTTILGGAAMQMKELSKGRTPRPMDDWRFWQAAFLQGGGLGLYGDFFLGDYSRFGRNPVTEIVGPMGGLTSDVMGAVMGNMQKELDSVNQGKASRSQFARDIFTIAKRNTPAVNLWYSRLAVERILLDNIERAVDPKFDQRVRRMERKARKSKQEYWWSKGDTTPDL